MSRQPRLSECKEWLGRQGFEPRRISDTLVGPS